MLLTYRKKLLCFLVWLLISKSTSGKIPDFERPSDPWKPSNLKVILDEKNKINVPIVLNDITRELESNKIFSSAKATLSDHLELERIVMF